MILILESEEQRERLRRLMTMVTLVSEGLHGQLPDQVQLPAKDQPILLAAIQARASHLLTGDKQHSSAQYGQVIAGVLILRPADYRVQMAG